MVRSRSKLWLLQGLGIVVSLSLIGYLLVEAWHNDVFLDLARRPKHWRLIGVAFLLTVVNTFAAITRWYCLARSLRFQLSFRQAVRLGLQGGFLNYLVLGGLGEDAYKAFFLARQQRRRRGMAALFTVFVDRVLGIYALLVVGSIGVLCSHTYRPPFSAEVRFVSGVTLLAAVGSTLGIVGCFLISPRMILRIVHPLKHLPMVGKPLTSVVRAIAAYRKRPSGVIVGTVISLAIHGVWILIFYLIAAGLGLVRPTLAQHVAIVPIAVLTMILPLPLEALGAFDLALSHLYEATSGSHDGVIVAFGYRVLTITSVALPLTLALLFRRRGAVLAEPDVDDPIRQDTPMSEFAN